MKRRRKLEKINNKFVAFDPNFDLQRKAQLFLSLDVISSVRETISHAPKQRDAKARVGTYREKRIYTNFACENIKKSRKQAAKKKQRQQSKSEKHKKIS